MKRFLFLSWIAAAAVWSAGCDDKDEARSTVRTTVGIAITDNAENQATVSAEILTGEFVRAKIIENYPVADLTFDYNTEVKLVKFVEENGTEVTLPYTNTVTKLKSGRDYISAVIAYNRQGRACCSAFETWTASGEDGLWSNDNSAGGLEENEW
ncbi:MAG: hypothetical protein K2K30_01855 [Alistipes sp.]|nr:hypothetical protein [Alistipes sp.]